MTNSKFESFSFYMVHNPACRSCIKIRSTKTRTNSKRVRRAMGGKGKGKVSKGKQYTSSGARPGAALALPNHYTLGAAANTADLLGGGLWEEVEQTEQPEQDLLGGAPAPPLFGSKKRPASEDSGIAPAAKKRGVPPAPTPLGCSAWPLHAFCDWMLHFAEGVEKAVQEKETHASILAEIPAAVSAEFGLPATCGVYVHEAWISSDSAHLKQLSLVGATMLQRQAESLSSLLPGKSNMSAKAELQNYGLLQLVCEHSRCPSAIQTSATQRLLAELKREIVPPEVMESLLNLQQEMLKKFFTPSQVAQLLKLGTNIITSKKEPSAATLKGLLEAIPGALAGLLKLYPEKYQKQKRANWRSEAGLTWNLALAAANSFQEGREEEPTVETEEEEGLEGNFGGGGENRRAGGSRNSRIAGALR